MQQSIYIPITLVALLSLSACQNLPTYEKPAVELPGGYAEHKTTISSLDHPADLIWWQSFLSDRLRNELAAAINNNLSLKASEKSLAQATAFYQAQEAGFNYPKIDANVSAQNLRVNPATLGQTSPAREFELYQASLSARYQFDLSGSQAQTLSALAAKTDYARWQNRANQQSLVGQWLVSAVLLAKNNAEQTIINQLIALQKKQVAIAEQREALGQGQTLDRLALQTQLKQTESRLPTLVKQQQQLVHLMNALSGSKTPPNTVKDVSFNDFKQTKPPLVIPSVMIQQRPDIMASEALVKAAHAEYGLSLTRYYPNITLTASTGTQALTTAGLFGAGSAVWGLMAQVTQPLFDASLPEQEKAALLGFEAASMHYQQVIVDAMRQVADSLSAIEQDRQTLRLVEEAELNAQQLIDITEQQYRLGSASYLQLLSAQQQRIEISLASINLKAQTYINQVNLAIALGSR